MTKLTLNLIRSKSPCESGWEKLLESMNKTQADDTEISIRHLLESNGVDDTCWVINNCIEGDLDKKRNMYADFAESAVEHAERVLHIFEKERPQDDRPKIAIEKSREAIRLTRAAWAAGAAGDAGDAAGDAERQEREKQKQIILKYFGDNNE